MYPILFTINSFEVRALPFFVVVGLIVFGINLWKDTKEMRNFAFDFFLANLILNPVVARIMHILLNLGEYEGIGWTLLPIKDTSEGVEFFSTFPWVFFSFWEKGMNLQFMPVVLVLSIILVRQFKRLKFREMPLVLIWRSFMMGFVFVLLGFFLDGSYLAREIDFPFLLRYKGQSVDLLPVHLLEVVALLFCLIFYLDAFRLKNRNFLDGLKLFLFPVYWGVVQVAVWFSLEKQSEDIWILSIAQIVWIVFILLLIILLLPWPENFFKSKDKFERKSKVEKRKPRNIEKQVESDYNYSFSNYKKGVKTKMTVGERIKQTKNKIRRGI